MFQGRYEQILENALKVLDVRFGPLKIIPTKMSRSFESIRIIYDFDGEYKDQVFLWSIKPPRPRMYH